MSRASASASRSASSRASSARRCSPCDPYARSSRPARRNATSSRCGPWPLKPRSRSDVHALGELRGELGGVRGLRTRPVAQLGALAQAQRLRERREARCQQIDDRCAIVAQRDPVTGELGVPRAQRVARRAAAADRRQQRVALGQRAAVGASRRAAGGPARSDDLVDVRAAQRRRALDELQAVGHEDADERAHLDVDEALDEDAVGLQALRLARAEADRQLVRAALAVAQVDLDACGGGVEADDLALVGGAARAAGAAEVQRLEQVRLAGAVAPVHHRQARPEVDVRALVATKVAQPQARDEHRAALVDPSGRRVH